jgi:predicted transcriptional regulator
MTSREKVLSYLENRKGEPVTNEAIAIGTKLKLGTVGPLVARLIDQGFVQRTTVKKKNRAGREMGTVVIHGYVIPEFETRRKKPLKRKWIVDAADLLEEAANRVLTIDVTGESVADTLNALDVLRIARDSWRDLKRQEGHLWP